MIGVRIGAMTVGTGAMIAETDARRTTDPLRWFDSLRAPVADAGFLGRARVNEDEAGFGPRSHLETTGELCSIRKAGEPHADSSRRRSQSTADS
jgi:hypothetical protein